MMTIICIMIVVIARIVKIYLIAFIYEKISVSDNSAVFTFPVLIVLALFPFASEIRLIMLIINSNISTRSNILFLIIDGRAIPRTNILSHIASNFIPNSDTQLYFLAILPSIKSVEANNTIKISDKVILLYNIAGITKIGAMTLDIVNIFGI